MSSQLNVGNPSNFRELGGHLNGSLGIRSRTLFRSDHLGSLDANDARQIQALGVRRVLDFRGVHERAAAVCCLPDVTVHSLAIEPTIVQKLNDMIAAGHELTEADVVALMQDTYRGFVRHNTHRFAEFFAHLLESNEPTVFHCTAGKDRTGFAAALVLLALEVSPQDVMQDYLLTNERLKMPQFDGGRLHPRVAGVLHRVQPEFLLAAFAAVDNDYGNLEGYFREGLRVRENEKERLRELYLQPPRIR